MWIMLACGAVAGLILGSFLTPGPAFWVVLGVAGGYIAAAWQKKRRAAQQERDARP